jgi:hypothetical protein
VKHGQERSVERVDPWLVYGLSVPMEEHLILERAWCQCQGRCECDDPKEKS